MNNKFDELAKGLAQSATRRQALKKFGVGLTGIVLATLGLPNSAEAKFVCDCGGDPFLGCKSTHGGCFRYCSRFCSGGRTQPVGEPCDCSQPPYWGCNPTQKGCVKKCGRLCG
jgi:hypothetical protein